MTCCCDDIVMMLWDFVMQCCFHVVFSKCLPHIQIYKSIHAIFMQISWWFHAIFMQISCNFHAVWHFHIVHAWWCHEEAMVDLPYEGFSWTPHKTIRVTCLKVAIRWHIFFRIFSGPVTYRNILYGISMEGIWKGPLWTICIYLYEFCMII